MSPLSYTLTIVVTLIGTWRISTRYLITSTLAVLTAQCSGCKSAYRKLFSHNYSYAKIKLDYICRYITSVVWIWYAKCISGYIIICSFKEQVDSYVHAVFYHLKIRCLYIGISINIHMYINKLLPWEVENHSDLLHNL